MAGVRIELANDLDFAGEGIDQPACLDDARLGSDPAEAPVTRRQCHIHAAMQPERAIGKYPGDAADDTDDLDLIICHCKSLRPQRLDYRADIDLLFCHCMFLRLQTRAF
jgi:hypothetical protein